MVGRTGQLAGQPHIGASLLLHLRPYELSDMYLLDRIHKKSVEFVPCLNVRVSTPYISNKLFHAVTIYGIGNLSLRCFVLKRGRCGNSTFKDSYKRYLICMLLVFSLYRLFFIIILVQIKCLS